MTTVQRLRSRLAPFRPGRRRRLAERRLASERKANAALTKEIARLKARQREIPRDADDETRQVIGLVRDYTMTSNDKLIALVAGARHIADTGVPGAIVECGVWRGGSIHAVARVFAARGVLDRDMFLFDTYTGMTEPTEKDRTPSGKAAADMLASSKRTAKVWAVASREDVEQGLRTLPYPFERFTLVEGPVEETIPDAAPDQIAMLRLDTDWYESTRHELENLYDRLVSGGVLIIDDYGSWQGSKEATDEFIARLPRAPLLLRAGRARIGVKP